MKGICTECFLQMKTPNSTRPTQCPFCKTLNYAVEYRGVKTKEEKGIEQIEEQRVIEAKIRIRQQELQDEEERMQKRQEMSYSSRIVEPSEVEYSSTAVPSSGESEEIVSVQHSSAATIRQPLRSRQNREDEFDLDLEDIMVMEAIWLSIQEDGKHRNPTFDEAAPSEHYVTEARCVSSAAMAPQAESSSSTTSPSGGLACAIAALAERQQMGGESSSNTYSGNMSTYNTPPGCSRFTNGDGQEVSQSYLRAESSAELSPDSHLPMAREDGEWGEDHHGSNVVEVVSGYAADSDVVEDHDGGNTAYTQHDGMESSYQTVAGPIVPESFEEQMMLAMAVSLAEARGRTSAPGVAWH